LQCALYLAAQIEQAAAGRKAIDIPMPFQGETGFDNPVKCLKARVLA
jgi:hypothetical protein